MLIFNFLLDLAILSSTAFILLYLYFIRKFDYWKNKNVPFLKPLPIFGNIIDGIMMRKSIGEVFSDLYFKTAEPFIGLFVLAKPCLLLRDPKLIKQVLVTDFQYFYDRTATNNIRDDPVGSYVLALLKNPAWKEIRTKMTPTFTSSKIKTMSKLLETVGQEMVEHLSESVKKDNVVETKKICCKFTVDVITSTAFGVNANCFKVENSEFNVVAEEIFDWKNLWRSFQMRCYFIAPTLVNLFRMKVLNPSSNKFLKKSFIDIMEQRINSKTKRNDFIDILLQMKSSDSNFIEGDQLVAQAVMFFAAGFETSSSTMNFALYEIAKNPEIQNKLNDEIMEMSEKYGGINYESIKEMTYLDMCVREALRKYPIIPFLDRECNSNYNIPGTDVNLEKGTAVFISLLGLHHDPQYFPDPEKYDPERFAQFNKQTSNFTYLAFGEGPRGCIGERFGMLSAKLGIAYIVKHFRVSPCGETPKKIKFQCNGMLLSPIDEIKLKYEKICSA